MELKSVEDTSWLQLFIKNSCSHRFSATRSRFGRLSHHATRAHLLPKLRCQFAEFLLPSSLKRLSIFSSPTSVGFRYGRLQLKLRGFSWNHIQSLRGTRPLVPSPRWCASGFAYWPPTIRNRDIQHPDDLQQSVPPSHWKSVQEYWPASHRLRLSPSS